MLVYKGAREFPPKVKVCPSHIKEPHVKEGVDEKLLDAMGIDTKTFPYNWEQGWRHGWSFKCGGTYWNWNKKVMVDYDEEDDLMCKILDHSHQIPKCNNITQVSKGD